MPETIEQPATAQPLRSTDLLAGADAQIAAQITKYRDGILLTAARKIDNHFLNKPVDDFSPEEEGFERGLRAAITEITALIHDKKLFR